MTGVSNGGYLTRFALEHHPELYDGGVDWEGTLLESDLSGPHLFRYLPTALRHYPQYATGSEADHDAMLAAGFPAGSEVLWFDHWSTLWDATQRAFREEFDPDYDGDFTGGVPFCQAGTATPGCDADYDLSTRPAAVRDALTRADIVVTGDIRRPLLTLHGTLDAVLPITTDSDRYEGLVERAGRQDLHRYYVIQDGTHIDGKRDAYPDQVRPILPCYRAAFAALVAWARDGAAPPPSGLVARPAGGDVVNTCTLPAAAAPPSAVPEAPPVRLAIAAAGIAAVVLGRQWVRRRASAHGVT
jgi:hypothetical protein